MMAARLISLGRECALTAAGVAFLLTFECLPLKIALGNLLEIAKGLTSIFPILDLRYLPAIDPQMPLPSGSDIYFKRIGSNGRDELLESGASSHRNILVRLPACFSCSHDHAPHLAFIILQYSSPTV